MTVAPNNVQFLYQIADEHAAAGRYEEAALALHYAARLTAPADAAGDPEVCLIGHGDEP